jgi:hypothetical protein
MGQRALGLLYGTQAPVLCEDEAEDEARYAQLLSRFHAAAGLPYWLPRVFQRREGTHVLLGVWVALGGSGAPGIDFLVEEAVPLEALPAYYAEAMAEATRVWDVFTKYCARDEQLEVPGARLWLTPTEVA